MPTCTICGKEAKNGTGLSAHMRSHASKEEPAVEAVPAEVTAAPAPVKDNYVEITRVGEFALAKCGDQGVLTDLTGKRLSRPMHIDQATNVFQRMASSKR